MKIKNPFAMSHLWIVPLTGLMLGGCQEASQEQSNQLTITRVSAEEISQLGADERMILSTREESMALVFNPEYGDIDFGKIDLECPNGLQMSMNEWLRDLEVTRSVERDDLTSREFSVASTRSNAIAALNQEDSAKQAPGGTETKREEGCCLRQECYLCTDGSWVCTCVEWDPYCTCGPGVPCP